MSHFMEIALSEARMAGGRGDVPVGAAVVDAMTGQVIAKAGNAMQSTGDPTAHAELLVLRDACLKLGRQRLDNCDIYVTLEPCAMCAAAISFARFRRLYYGAADPKGGAVEHGSRFFESATCHHAPEVYDGIGEEPARLLLKQFFEIRRKQKV
jgi:tRNA(adenine34) deaminase